MGYQNEICRRSMENGDVMDKISRRSMENEDVMDKISHRSKENGDVTGTICRRSMNARYHKLKPHCPVGQCGRTDWGATAQC